jgi:murein DD-endopeptidase MepM/ murein hydrolase activator NlpD
LLDLARKLRKSVFSPTAMVKEIWFYNYQDFRLIFEQSDLLHYFYVSANSQRLLARIFIVTIATLLMMILALALHSGVSVWRYKNLEASKILAEQKREEALNALAALSEDDLDYKHGTSPDELIKVAQGYKDRLNKMQTLVEFSARELKLANRALEQGLNASGIGGNVLQKMKAGVSSIKTGIGGNSEELKFDKATDKTLANYKKNLAQLEQTKQVYKSLPVDSPVSKAITTSKYGVRIHPITNKLTIHEGLDYVPTFDTNAKSVLAGVIEKAEYSNTGYGNMVVVLHPNKVRTIYAHLDSIAVKPAQHVEQGSVLGKIGNTGFSTGRHLHYEISIDNVKVNPSIITAMAKNVQ